MSNETAFSLPSQFQPGDELTLKVKVHGVIFTDAKVNYLVEDKCGEVHRIDSCAIHYLTDDEPAPTELARDGSDSKGG